MSTRFCASSPSNLQMQSLPPKVFRALYLDDFNIYLTEAGDVANPERYWEHENQI